MDVKKAKISKVLPHLYVGNLKDSRNRQQLRRAGITHILTILDNPRRVLYDKHYLCIAAEDECDQNLMQFFSVANDFIHAARLNNDNVLVHCFAGVSRSVTLTVAYIMTVTDLDWQNALYVVQAERYIALPNDGFKQQLIEFQATGLNLERNRLLRKFPENCLKKTDMDWCKDALGIHAVLVATNPTLFECNDTVDSVAACLSDSTASNENDLENYKQSPKTIVGSRIRREHQLEVLEQSSSGEDLLVNVRLYKPMSKSFRDCQGKFVGPIDNVEQYRVDCYANMEEEEFSK